MLRRLFGLRRAAPAAQPRSAEDAPQPDQPDANAQEAGAPLFVAPGHFYSPIVDPEALRATGWREPTGHLVPEVELRLPEQLALFRRLARHFGPAEALFRSGARYRFPNDFLALSDALILSAMIREFRPRQIVEAGSGFSSAVMFDTVEAAGLAVRLTFIDPSAERLKTLLREGDTGKVSVLEQPVQTVELALFEALEADDILYLDTTHVAKTGSDVLHELFEVLPRLKPGVIIHFHDVFNGFEYPEPWVLGENRSWNESYLLRAFLANNSRYRVEMFANALVKAFPEEVAAAAPSFRLDGGGLWLRKVG